MIRVSAGTVAFLNAAGRARPASILAKEAGELVSGPRWCRLLIEAEHEEQARPNLAREEPRSGGGVGLGLGST